MHRYGQIYERKSYKPVRSIWLVFKSKVSKIYPKHNTGPCHNRHSSSSDLEYEDNRLKKTDGLLCPCSRHLVSIVISAWDTPSGLILNFYSSTACAVVHYILVSKEWENPDVTGTRHMGSLFVCLENATGVICCSLPVIAFLAARVGSSRFGSSLRRLLPYGSRSGLNYSGGRAGSGSNDRLRTSENNGLSRPLESSARGYRHVWTTLGRRT